MPESRSNLSLLNRLLEITLGRFADMLIFYNPSAEQLNGKLILLIDVLQDVLLTHASHCFLVLRQIRTLRAICGNMIGTCF